MQNKEQVKVLNTIYKVVVLFLDVKVDLHSHDNK